MLLHSPRHLLPSPLEALGRAVRLRRKHHLDVAPRHRRHPPVEQVQPRGPPAPGRRLGRGQDLQEELPEGVCDREADSETQGPLTEEESEERLREARPGRVSAGGGGAEVLLRRCHGTSNSVQQRTCCRHLKRKKESKVIRVISGWKTLFPT